MPLLGPTLEGRNAVFQRLKPRCIALSQAVLSTAASKIDIKGITARLEELHHSLDAIATQREALDAKLADYVFFPLSQVLKASQKLSVSCLELSLACIAILIGQGWRTQIQPQLAAQIAILCTMMAEKKPKGLNFEESTDELQCMALSCLQRLFVAIEGSPDGKALLTSEANFPQLGQTISVILDDIHDSISTEVQLTAAQALLELINHVADREICASFLPGIVSKLTKVLTLSTKHRRNYNVLIQCLNALATLLWITLGHKHMKKFDSNSSTTSGLAKTSIIDANWKEGAATQLKVALGSIMRLRAHSRSDVREALAALCLVVLEDCRASLVTSNMLVLETLVAMLAHGGNDEIILVRLEMLARQDESVLGLLQSLLYDYMQSCITVMSSSDEPAKVQKLKNMESVYALLTNIGAATTTLERMLANTLRDSVVITITNRGANRDRVLSDGAPIQSLDLAIAKGNSSRNMEFSQPLVRYRGQEEIMLVIEDFARRLSNTSSSTSSFVPELARDFRRSQGEARIANFWLLLVNASGAMQRKDVVSDFLEFGDGQDDRLQTDDMEELYSSALTLLTDQTIDTPDPRLQALALRALALRAQQAGEEFRYELVDALYPVLHTMATPDETLQRDSITTLNVFTSVCGYSSVDSLIVDNVDYLTNAVALKLNSFDVSPHAPQVLLMMVRLAGTSLLPYLDDTVESIFAALEDFHGYPLLVELLFKVLSVVAEEGTKAPLLAINGPGAHNEAANTTEDSWTPSTVDALATMLVERKLDVLVDTDSEQTPSQAHPTKPWKRIEEVEEEDDLDGSDAGSDHQAPMDDQQLDDSDVPPPAPKTYALLLKIAGLTQHFLPSASPSLRGSLLALIRTTVPAIARHENSFLPLINTLWPEIVSRLDDAEPAHVKGTALETVSALCEYAGSFMRSRIEALWPRLVEMYHKTAEEFVAGSGVVTGPTSARHTGTSVSSSAMGAKAVARMQPSVADYHGDVSLRLLWDALVDTLTTIVDKVDLTPEASDEALELLQPMLKQDKVRAALSSKNDDALWLAEARCGGAKMPAMPVVPDAAAWRFVAVNG